MPLSRAAARKPEPTAPDREMRNEERMARNALRFLVEDLAASRKQQQTEWSYRELERLQRVVTVLDYLVYREVADPTNA